MTQSNDQETRAPTFKRNEALEALLTQLNTVLRSAEDSLVQQTNLHGPDFPIVFVMGPLRSGTTLFMQWLAASGIVAYPTNLLSRFYGAPVIGAKIQLLLTDPRFNFRNEIPEFNTAIQFTSENGKTQGALAPNEFWYFWRRFLPFQELDWLSNEDLLRRVDQTGLVGELTALTRAFGKPFALKGMILNYNIHFLDTIFRKALFVQIQRQPVANVASVLEARLRQFGNETTWYSFKIPEYPQLKDCDPITQAAGQVHYINGAVTAGMQSLDESRRLVVQYEQFCESPETTYRLLLEKLGLDAPPYAGPARFEYSRDAIVARQVAIEQALAQFEAIG